MDNKYLKQILLNQITIMGLLIEVNAISIAGVATASERNQESRKLIKEMEERENE